MPKSSGVSSRAVIIAVGSQITSMPADAIQDHSMPTFVARPKYFICRAGSSEGPQDEATLKKKIRRRRIGDAGERSKAVRQWIPDVGRRETGSEQFHVPELQLRDPLPLQLNHSRTRSDHFRFHTDDDRGALESGVERHQTPAAADFENRLARQRHAAVEMRRLVQVPWDAR